MNKKRTAPTDSSVVWRNLKRIAGYSGIEVSKVYPHNFRHMFAREYMKTFNNLVELADILGHSSIETTRIYTKASKEPRGEDWKALICKMQDNTTLNCVCQPLFADKIR